MRPYRDLNEHRQFMRRLSDDALEAHLRIYDKYRMDPEAENARWVLLARQQQA